MPKIEINKEKCVHCGMCINDCSSCCLEFDADRFPKFAPDGEKRCLACQHCMSVCPAGAVSFNGINPDEASPVKYAAPEDVLNLIKSRRSIRQYKNEDIPEEIFSKLKQMFPYIPTGCNTNTLYFSIVKSKAAMDVIKKETNSKLLKLISNKFASCLAGKFAVFKTALENGEDVIYRGASAMIVVSSSVKAPCANVDPIIALSYIELYAQSLGLGTCWCGFAQACIKMFPELSKMLDVPYGYKAVYAMLLGIPAVKYKRTTLPESFPVSEITNEEIPEMSFKDKAKRTILNFTS